MKLNKIVTKKRFNLPVVEEQRCEQHSHRLDLLSELEPHNKL
jgi:hypothetical protein